MSEVDNIKKRIAEIGSLLRKLKTDNASEPELEAAKLQLEDLKTALREKQGITTTQSKKETQFVLKTPKGTKDYNEKEMIIREEVLSKITTIFKKYGGVPIDTPVFELKDILTGKYGEDSKLIYDLQDQGGEKCSLRYDLTVPFARFVAMNKISNIKRYHVAKVYRRDQPAMTKGRMREFYQCDFDIAGQYDTMLPDVEIVSVANEVLTTLDIGEFIIKVNHRKVLDGIFDICGVPEDKIRQISSAIDKLDKLPWEDVYKEMTVDKGLDPKSADKIGTFVKLNGGKELVSELLNNIDVISSEKTTQGLQEMKSFFEYAEAYGITKRIRFDLSLARGLDYYTGIIYEAVLVQEDNKPEQAAKPKKSKSKNEDDDSQARIGSVAAGGRYDELVGMFSGSGKSGAVNKIPCVGVSFGIERLFAILSSKKNVNELKPNHTSVYVLSVGEGMLFERIQIVNILREHGINTEFMLKEAPRLQAQYNICDKAFIPYSVIVGRDEWSKGMVRVKNMQQKETKELDTLNQSETANDSNGTLVEINSLVEKIKSLLA
ncbi:hypothetical protein BB561_002943 [Smittium simulii]|uniref:histidine--tRNA ligase n=1 Tax=Smittium simulii TaxID=133385 RepID=A0A2T9YNJ7_9FUNG|nr:hypothetical protein BB561_002943 [Smittium simulii]